MMTQIDLFAPHYEIRESLDAEHETAPVRSAATPIAVPCGFSDRYNRPCKRLGNWPVMIDGKQMGYRDRPMVRCDPACFKSDPPVPHHGMTGDDVIWGDKEAECGDFW